MKETVIDNEVQKDTMDITHIVKRLPEDIKKQMYKDYFETKVLRDELNTILKSDLCRKLYPNELAKILPKVLSNEMLVNYLKKDPAFDFVYKLECYNIANVPYKTYEKFASLWLYNIYFKDIFPKNIYNSHSKKRV